MDTFPLKDHRAAHILVNFLRCQAQGWYTREKILALAGQPAGQARGLEAAAGWIEKAAAWSGTIEQGREPLLSASGAFSAAAPAGELKILLNLLFAQYVDMNGRLNAILDSGTPLHERRTDFQYVVACLGWVYYAVNNAVRHDISFGKKFGDLELLAAREGHAAASQKEIEFVNYLVHVFRAETTYNPQTCGDIVPMIEEAMNASFRVWAGQADKYLGLLEA